MVLVRFVRRDVGGGIINEESGSADVSMLFTAPSPHPPSARPTIILADELILSKTKNLDPPMFRRRSPLYLLAARMVVGRTEVNGGETSADLDSSSSAVSIR
ncbi:hypothetical protein OROMI_019184 [Orobanche minor]